MVTHPSSPDSLCNKSKLCRPSNQQKFRKKSAISKNFQIAALAISYPSKLLSAISGAGAKSAATLALALHPQLTADKTPSFPSGDEDKDDADVADYDNKVADYDGGDGLHQQFNSR